MSTYDSDSDCDSQERTSPYQRQKCPQPHVDYIPGPQKCPGVYNKKPSKGALVRKLVYAIPVTLAEIDLFICKYWPGGIPEDSLLTPKTPMFFEDFEGRPKETRSVVVVYVPFASGPVKYWEPFALVLGFNATPESIEEAESYTEAVQKIHEYFEMKREPAWYPFRFLAR
ncbi:hypothetical protein BJ165DRAFT_776359 [Panaeolus papilionaceus]|nr:hypothetical protein BJ165DRAFT_776359 [Panaeolus papilionaceus]